MVEKDANGVLDEIESAIFQVHCRKCRHKTTIREGTMKASTLRLPLGCRCTPLAARFPSILIHKASCLASAIARSAAAQGGRGAAANQIEIGEAWPVQAAVMILKGQGFSYSVPSRAKGNQLYVPELDRIVLKVLELLLPLFAQNCRQHRCWLVRNLGRMSSA